jgi:hypothetical protein
MFQAQEDFFSTLCSPTYLQLSLFPACIAELDELHDVGKNDRRRIPPKKTSTIGPRNHTPIEGTWRGGKPDAQAVRRTPLTHSVVIPY